MKVEIQCHQRICCARIGLRGIIDLAGNVIVPAEADLRETANKFQYEKRPKVKNFRLQIQTFIQSSRDRQFKGQSSWKSIDKHPGMELRGGFRQAGQDHGPREDKSSNYSDHGSRSTGLLASR